MADTSDDTLRTYLDTVLRLQREREESAWSDADLQEAALAAGMTDTDLAYVRRHLADCMNRGQGFLRYQNWDDAVEELERARALAPNSTEILVALAAAYAGRWHQNGSGSDRDLALQRAELALRLDSRNEAALRMVSALKTKRIDLLGRKAGSTRSFSARKLIVVLGLIVLGGLGFLALRQRSADTSKSPALPSASTPTASTPPPAPAREGKPVPVPPKPKGTSEALLTFGSEGIGPGLLSDARAIAVDGAGRVYVADYSDGRIQAFDSAGNYLLQWSIGENHYVKGIAADRKGTVYVVHSGKIHRYDGSTGKALGEVKYAGGPGFVSVAVMADGGLAAAWDGLFRGGLFINPKSQDNLVIFDANMRAVRTIKNPLSSVSGNVEFSPKVAVDGLGNFYMIGESGSAIYHFTPQGKYIDRFGGDGESGRLRSARGIAVDGRGHIFVTDFSGVREFDGDGRQVGSMELRGSSDAIAFNDKGEMYVVARTKVMKFPATRQ